MAVLLQVNFNEASALCDGLSRRSGNPGQESAENLLPYIIMMIFFLIQDKDVYQ